MNNFYITVSNGLLTTDHRRRMGSAVWEFMWCLDKITRVEGDIGYVLGGKPVQLKDIGLLSDARTSEHLTKLEKAGYISTTNTPYGIIIRVYKAKKRFSKKSIDEEKENSGNVKPPSDFVKPPSENVKPNKTVSVDKTVDSIAAQDAADDGELIASLIKEFEPVNPSVHKLYPNKTQRAAVSRLLKKFGYDKVLGMVRSLPKSNASRYGPKITTPYELEDKLGKLIAFYKSESTTKPHNKIIR